MTTVPADIENMTVTQLKEFAAEHGISIAGLSLKNDIKNAIITALENTSGGGV